ncbi:cytosine-specific methyltransferase [Thiosulfatimonas sediminis]|uniref:DNA (cytosine-5-)-methyltransferase n=1 Tax=Thiosulfatimonas sediminis TaxID=2675054 RepID=A0A6F8PTS1_9GAMM|nr:DNA cytosine methyltransferase [Thiosulfatimonas sediminis]BBP45380.1 cytosine-specific methyltransferase [Thiosulfatimonas sediminis]
MAAIDLFAGAGGFSLAAYQAGIDVLAAIELDSQASNTYRENLIERLNVNTKFIEGDILKVNPADLREELALERGEIQLILGGPPCQGFSSHRIKNSGVNDPRNQLLLRYFDFVEEFRPQAFLVENVSGLFWARHADYLEKFKKLASDNGYKIKFCDVINAKDYGVPQNRKRAFILGVREDVNIEGFAFPPKKTHFSPNSVEVVDGGLPAWKTVSTVFEPISEELKEKYISDYFLRKTSLNEHQARNLLDSLEFGCPIGEDDPCNFHMVPTTESENKYQATPLNGSREDAGEEFRLPCHSNGYGGHKDVYGRMFIHLPANTITTGCHNPSKGRFVHPWKNHGITLRHAARIQTFPDDFIFTGTSTSQAKQVGNAVPVELGLVLITSIMNVLN